MPTALFPKKSAIGQPICYPRIQPSVFDKKKNLRKIGIVSKKIRYWDVENLKTTNLKHNITVT